MKNNKSALAIFIEQNQKVEVFRMKRIILAIFVAFFMATPLTNTTAAPAGQLDQILDNMQKKAATIKTIFAGMNQEKYDSSIGGAPEKYSGQIFFKHAGKNNDKACIKYFIPKGQIVWINGDQIILYQAATGTAYISSRKAQASKNSDLGFAATPYTSVPELKRQYNIVYVGDDQGMAKLELTPKSKSSLKKMTLWVDQSMWLPTKSQVVESNNTITTFTLSNLKVNGSIPDNTFKPSYPSGTKTVTR